MCASHVLEDFLSAWSKTMHMAQLTFTAYASQSVLPGTAHNGYKGLRFKNLQF